MSEETTLNLKTILDNFSNDFTHRRLDSVVEYFAEHAEYRELGGNIIVGKKNIRQALQRLFDGAYGNLNFESKHLMIDAENRAVCFVWNCQHSLLGSQGLDFINKIIYWGLRLWYGQQFYWEGVDYFIFDHKGKIISKQTYGKAILPKFIRGKSNH